ncbi:MAG: biopolymer transporter ExbD [Wenzhouxiangellaceae bacterium]
MARRHAHNDEPEINITPMLDIVFIMLIFFIVTTSFIKETGVEVERPAAVSALHKPQGNILIAIRSNDEVWMNKREVEVREVRGGVEEALAENPEGSVVIVADKGARTGVLVKVMDQIKLAGGNIPIAVAASEHDGS